MLNHLSARAHVAMLSRKQEGASAVEYGLILGILAVIFITGFTLLGGTLEGVFTDVSTAISGAG